MGIPSAQRFARDGWMRLHCVNNLSLLRNHGSNHSIPFSYRSRSGSQENGSEMEDENWYGGEDF
jgi:hypothetical protein